MTSASQSSVYGWRGRSSESPCSGRSGRTSAVAVAEVLDDRLELAVAEQRRVQEHERRPGARLAVGDPRAVAGGGRGAASSACASPARCPRASAAPMRGAGAVEHRGRRARCGAASSACDARRARARRGARRRQVAEAQRGAARRRPGRAARSSAARVSDGADALQVGVACAHWRRTATAACPSAASPAPGARRERALDRRRPAQAGAGERRAPSRAAAPPAATRGEQRERPGPWAGS